MKTVVTGGTGFIGSHLVRRLLERGRQVIVASDLFRLGSENLSGLGIGPSELELRSTDLADYQQALKAMEGADSVFHLAARVGSLEYLHGTEMSELLAVQTNLVIDANVFRACLENRVKKLVYASSCAVYPMNRQHQPGAVFSEEDLGRDTGQGTIDPDGGYGWSKLMGEVQLGWMKNIDIGIARIFNIYGENEPVEEGKAHLVADLFRKVILSPQSQLSLRGDGRQTLDFLYVSDCADALLALEEKTSNPAAIVNIGSGNAVSIRTIAEKVAEITGLTAGIAYDAARTAGPKSRAADISNSRALLGWQPRVSLDEGLRLSYSWIQRKLQEKTS